MSASPFRHISDVVRGLYGRIQSGASGEASEANERTSSRESLESDSNSGVISTARETSDEITEAHRDPSLEEDRDAEVRDRGPRGEFAVRRGGRGRRGRGGRREPPAPAPGTVAPGEEEAAVAAAPEQGPGKPEEAPKQDENARREEAQLVPLQLLAG